MIETHEEFKKGYRYTFSSRAYLLASALNSTTNIRAFRFDGSDNKAWYNWFDGMPVELDVYGDGYIMYTYGKGKPYRYNVVANWCIPEKIK